MTFNCTALKQTVLFFRVSNKLRGRDFEALDGSDKLNVKEQVQRLISQATNHENLCQAWIGWCPFW
jgi:FKBP12-rapamycin complex-associated protein